MTVHVISVGTSIIKDALMKPGEKLPRDFARAITDARPGYLLVDEDIPDHDRDGANGWLASALAAPGGPGSDPARAARLAEVTQAVSPDQWDDDFSAELETFASMGIRRPLPAGDIAVLVCSDTPNGLLAGAWNAVALARGSLAGVSYLADLSDSDDGKRLRGELLREARGQVVIARVAGMDAADNDGFRRAMKALGVLARDLFTHGDLSQAEPFWFHLSGGYKAAIPYLIGMAEAVRSVDETRLAELGAGDLMPRDGSPYPVKAFVLHDSAPANSKPIRLPLRRLFPEAVRGELKGFDDKTWKRQKKGKPDYAILEGYAYEVTGPAGKETCELTPFGAGLRAFFGVPGEVHG